MPSDPDQFSPGTAGSDPAAEIESLRSELVRVRADAEQQIGRLERQVELARNALPTQRDTGVVAANLAVQQDLASLRNALRERERLIEELNRQIRDLEDKLEDQYRAYDNLNRRVERAERERQEAEQRAVRAEGRAVQLVPATTAGPAPASALAPLTPEPRSALAPASAPMVVAGAAPAMLDAPLNVSPFAADERQPRRPGTRPVLPPPPSLAAAASRGRRRLVGGLLLGLVLAAVVAAGLWWFGHWPAPRASGAPLWPFASGGDRAPQRPAEPADAPAPTDIGAAGADPAAPQPPLVGETPGMSVPAVRGLVQDPDGPELIALAPARFRMGDAEGGPKSNARPVHEVSLGPFMIGRNEVTFAEYDRFVEATGARRPDDAGLGRGNRPVLDVTWDEAVAYADWLARRTGQPYRLPSEAEWEYAARAGSATAYWWGPQPQAGRAVCLDCGSAFDGRSPAPAGSFAPNAFGLHDTAGNVYEWVADCYRPSYRDAPADGAAVDLPGCRQRVVRGGSFMSPSALLRSADRRSYAPSARTSQIGFRIARDG